MNRNSQGKIPKIKYPLDILSGRGQVDLKNAFRISFGRAVRDKIRIIIGSVYAIIYAITTSIYSDSWFYGIISAVLYSCFITFFSVIPWRIKFHKKKTCSIWFILLTNGLLSIILGVLTMWVSVLIPIIILSGMKGVIETIKYGQLISIYGSAYVLVGIILLYSEEEVRRNKRREAYAKKLERLTEEAKAIALRSQINPHFFFNALNTIAALIPTRPSDAERAVELLGESLRPALMGDQPLLSTIETELKIAKAYTELEKLRYGKRINVEFHIDDETLYKLIPSLSLQPILENAFRHGAGKTTGLYEVALSIKKTQDGINIESINSPDELFKYVSHMKLLEVPVKEGHSINNIRLRLSALFSNKSFLGIYSNGDNIGYVKMFVPYEVKKELKEKPD